MAGTQTRALGIEYNVILTFTPDVGVEEIAAEFARYFKFEQEVAEQILRSCPVVFLRRMSKGDIKAIKPSLLELSKLGVEFTISPRLPKNIPSIIWPFQPAFAATAEGEVVKAINFQWAGNAVVCPGCGETFVFRPIGKPSLKVEETSVQAEAPAAPVDEAPAPVRTPPPEPPKTAAKPAQAPALARGKGLPPKRREEPKLPARGKDVPKLGRRPAKVPEPEPEPEPEIELTPIEEVEEIEEVTEVEEVVALEEPAAEVEEIAPLEEVVDLVEPDMEIVPLEELVEEPVKEPPKPAPKKAKEPPVRQSPAAAKPPAAIPKQAAAAPKPEPEPEPESEPEPVAKAPSKGAKRGAAEDAASGEVLFSVFLNRIPSKEKQEQAAKILATVRECSIAEAREQVKKVIIPVVRDVNKEEADNCLKKFTEIDVTGKMTKKK